VPVAAEHPALTRVAIAEPAPAKAAAVQALPSERGPIFKEEKLRALLRQYRGVVTHIVREMGRSRTQGCAACRSTVCVSMTISTALRSRRRPRLARLPRDRHK
jgi:hypothetical protein